MHNVMPIAIALHLLAAVIWVGGMFFAYVALRPVAASQLPPPQRLPLWSGTFSRFFPWVWIAVFLLPVTGYWMLFTAFGGLSHAGLHIQVMQALGWLMILLYLHVFFAPFRRLRRTVSTGDLAEAGKALAQIRSVIGINLLLGLAVVTVASAGRYVSSG